MKSYFEIAGDVIELVHSTSPSSSQFDAFVAERPERGRISARSESVMSEAKDTGESRSSLFEHWKTTSFYNLNRFLDLSMLERGSLMKNPHAFAWWGVQGISEVIGMHYDYLTE